MRYSVIAILLVGAAYAQIPNSGEVAVERSPLTCATILCQPGKVCVQERINCYVPPCPQPRPRCVDTNEPETCVTKKCPPGTTCKQMQIMCIRAPCVQPPATCEPEPVKQCGLNEERKECGSACEPQCNEPEHKICTLQCILNVCQCKNGFLRNAAGQCVAKEQCNATGGNNTRPCGQNEERTQCGTACEPSCKSPEPGICTKQCIVDVCQCQSGFVRDTYGRCVAKAECANIPEQPEISCANIDCRDGYKCVQDTINCIKAPCPPPQPRCEKISAPSNNSTNGSCRRNEEFRTCGTACEPQCGEYEPRPCTMQCIINVCQCQLGFYRNKNGDCVSRNECPSTRW